MVTQRLLLWLGPLGLVLSLVLSPLAAQDPLAAAPTNDVTVLATGPVHEAYAKPTTAAPQPGIIVPKQPPDPIPETPPDVKPQGQNVQWIPGYWGWDPDRSDFLWVSGFWRDIPPGERWVPGYWTPVDTGWQWVSGFWAPADQQDFPYTPQPPASLDTGPDTPAPDDDSIYVPGNWLYQDTGWVWRPGYWCPAQPGWVWTAASYSWTPAGYCYAPGFWDYALQDRGVLCAPVYFNRPLWNNPNWTFTPQYCVSPDAFLSSCFVWPQYGHYCFGDYYGNQFARLGIQPWLSWGPRWHDSLFGYYRWAHRGDHWFQDQRALFAGRQEGSLWRPGRTLAQQHQLLQRRNHPNVFNQRNPMVGNRNPLQTVTSFTNLRNRRVNGTLSSGFRNLRLTRLGRPQQEHFQAAARAVQQLRQDRMRTERTAAPGMHAPGSFRSGRARPQLRLPPVVGSNRGGVARNRLGRGPGTVPRPGARTSRPGNPLTDRQRPRTPFQGPRPGAVRPPSGNRTPGAFSRPRMRSPVPGRAAPRVAPRPAARPAPRSPWRPSMAPRVAPRPAPRPATRPTPRPAPAARAAPRPAPRPAARPVPRPALRPATPRPAPRPGARPAPRPAGGRRR